MKLTKERHEEIVLDYEKFNEFLSNFTEHLMQRVMMEIPNLVLWHIKDIKNMENIRKKFSETHGELLKHPELLTQCVNTVAAKHPEYDKEKIYEIAGRKAEEILKEEKAHGQGI